MADAFYIIILHLFLSVTYDKYVRASFLIACQVVSLFESLFFLLFLSLFAYILRPLCQRRRFDEWWPTVMHSFILSMYKKVSSIAAEFLFHFTPSSHLPPKGWHKKLACFLDKNFTVREKVEGEILYLFLNFFFFKANEFSHEIASGYAIFVAVVTICKLCKFDWNINSGYYYICSCVCVRRANQTIHSFRMMELSYFGYRTFLAWPTNTERWMAYANRLVAINNSPHWNP